MNIDQIVICYIIYQWISLNELYKLAIEFQISNYFSKFWLKTKKILKRLARREYWSNCNVLYIYIHIYVDSSQRALQTSGKLFFKFQKFLAEDWFFLNELLDFVFILNFWCYRSMDSYQRALQIYGKFFFHISN